MNSTSINMLNGTSNTTVADTAYHLFTPSEYVIQASFLVLISTMIIIGNSMVLAIMIKNKHMRSPQYLLIFSLALSDIGVGAITCPITMVTSFNNGQWEIGNLTCKFQAFMNTVFFFATMLTMMAMTLEKYFSVVRPLSRFITKKRTRIFMVCAWLSSLVIASFPLFGFGRYDFNGTTQSCGIAFPKKTSEKLFLVMMLFFGIVLPLIIMTIANARIFIAVHQHSKRLKKHVRGTAARAKIVASQKHFTITIIIILVLFVGSWTPFFLLATIAEVSDSVRELPPFLGIFAYWCGYAASVWNPVIYCTRNGKFRNGAREIKNCMICRRKESFQKKGDFGQTISGQVD